MSSDNAHLFLCFLLQRILGYRLERLFHVDRLLGGRLKVRNVALGLTPRHRPLLRHLRASYGRAHNPQRPSYLSFAFLHINLVTEDNKGEILRIMRTCLNKKLVSPAVQRLKRLCTVHVVHEHTAIRPSVVCHAERLEAFLTSRIPKLYPCQERPREPVEKGTCIVTRRSSTMTSLVRLNCVSAQDTTNTGTPTSRPRW